MQAEEEFIKELFAHFNIDPKEISKNKIKILLSAYVKQIPKEKSVKLVTLTKIKKVKTLVYNPEIKAINVDWQKVEKLAESVAKEFGVTIEQMKSKSRKPEYVDARQKLSILLKEKMEISYKLIGEYLGGRDYSTIMHLIHGRGIVPTVETQMIAI